MRALVISVWGVAFFSLFLPDGLTSGVKVALWLTAVVLSFWWCVQAVRDHQARGRQSEMQQRMMVAQMLANKKKK